MNPEIFSQEESTSDHDSEKSKSSTSSMRRKKERKQNYFYVHNSDDEADTLKDKFWRDLEEGKINVFGSDLYSKVKSQGRSARPLSFKEGKSGMLPPHELATDNRPKKLKRQDSKGSGTKTKSAKKEAVGGRSRSTKRRDSGDSGTSKTSMSKSKGRGVKKHKRIIRLQKTVDPFENDVEVQENVSDDWLKSDSDGDDGTSEVSSQTTNTTTPGVTEAGTSGTTTQGLPQVDESQTVHVVAKVSS